MNLTLSRSLVLLFIFTVVTNHTSRAQVKPISKTKDLEITDAKVQYIKDLDLFVFEQSVKGKAGKTLPRPAGQMNKAPVLAYVFPTSLSSTQVGFNEVEGIVALAVTSHPDFDDTPLWDENQNRDYEDDGIVFHTHWVVLQPDERVPGGLAVVEIQKVDIDKALPPTAPGMPMYLDSPGYSIVFNKGTLKVIVPASRIGGKQNFQFDAVTAYMEVNTSDESRPLLGVYEVYSILSGDLSLPYSVKR